MSISITGTFTPAGSGGFPLLSDQDLQGGWRVVANQTARDAIPTLDRIVGMLAYSVADGYGWQLIGGITNSNWMPAGNGFTAGGDLSGTSTNQTVIKINGHAVSSTAPTDGYVLTWV